MKPEAELKTLGGPRLPWYYAYRGRRWPSKVKSQNQKSIFKVKSQNQKSNVNLRNKKSIRKLKSRNQMSISEVRKSSFEFSLLTFDF